MGVVETYEAAVNAAGATLDPTARAALNGLYNRLRSTGIWDKLQEVWPCASSNISGAYVKLKTWPGRPGSYIPISFVGGDYTQAGGMVGDGASKYLSGGPLGDDLGLTPTLFVAVKAVTVAGGNRAYLGCITGGRQFFIGGVNPAAATDTRMSGVTSTSDANAVNPGKWAASRYSATSVILFQNGTAVTSSAAASTNTANANGANIFAWNSAGAAGAFMPCTLTGAAWGSQALTAADHAELSSAWTAFDTALGR